MTHVTAAVERVATPRELDTASPLPVKQSKWRPVPVLGWLAAAWHSFTASLNPSVNFKDAKGKNQAPTAVDMLRDSSAKAEMQKLQIGGRTVLVTKPSKLHRDRSALLTRGLGSTKDLHVDTDVLAVHHPSAHGHLPTHVEAPTPKASLVVEPLLLTHVEAPTPNVSLIVKSLLPTHVDAPTPKASLVVEPVLSTQ